MKLSLAYFDSIKHCPARIVFSDPPLRRLKECPDCCGDGHIIDEVRTRDTLKVIIECETCHGSGEVKEEDNDEE